MKEQHKKWLIPGVAVGVGVLLIAVVFSPAAFALRETNCADGIDNDGDGQIDGADDDCNAFPETNCADGIDNDGDGYIDTADSDCTAPPPVCPDWHKLVGQTCVPKQPSEGMNIQDLGINFNYDFAYTGGKWRVEGFVERTSPDPYPVWLLFRWVNSTGAIVNDERGGSISGLENPTEGAESVGDKITTNPASWGQQSIVYIYATQDIPVRIDGSLEYDVEGKTFQMIASRSFTPTAQQHSIFGPLFCLISPTC